MMFIYSYAVYGDNVKDAVLLSRPVLTDIGLFNTLLVQFGCFWFVFQQKSFFCKWWPASVQRCPALNTFSCEIFQLH